MRDFHDVKILRGVTHVVAPRSPQLLLQLSEAELPLGQGVGDILAAHVDMGLHDVQAKAATFVARRDDDACGILERLLSSRPRLVDLSRQLAQRLYRIAERDARVTDGTLAVLLCEATTSNGNSARFPSILKLDPSAKLRTVTDTEPTTHKLRVRYEVDSATLPSRHEKIQKCAFVREIDQAAEYEMLVVDRQRRAEVVSHFWVRDFLGAELVLDAPERTKRLYRALRSARNEVEQDLEATQLAALDQIIDGAVVGAAVDLDNLVASLPVPQPIRERIDATVSRALPDRQFDLDPGVARQFVRRRAYRADNDLRLSVRADFAQMIHIDDLEPGPEEGRLRRVWFETRTWRES
jgi:nucleoid-associated protein YejK